MDHRIRPRPIKVIIEPNEHDLRCACKTELGQLRNRLDALGNRMSRYDANYEPIYVPGGRRQGALGALGAPGGLEV